MTAQSQSENPYAGQGPVILDIGDDVGALIVTMPSTMEGAEVEIRSRLSHTHDHPQPVDRHDHQHVNGGGHHAHVAVVNRPLRDTHVASLVFPELVEGRYELSHKGTQEICLTVDIRGGEVALETWPH